MVKQFPTIHLILSEILFLILSLSKMLTSFL